ncbi:hypothetical protein DEO72_LG5g123 [Vigna unguiculata]|uniref:Uncharacterized protein n=1 Tax=Vigna unguiculata TaxID=3917 RepID=A0A4D6LU08_VIGUN|nr:hypothetical protein DEO72_LG5g123 [Vigna unguiculata]
MVKIGVGNGRLKKWFELGSGTLLHALIARISNGSVDCYLRVKTATPLLRRRHAGSQNTANMGRFNGDANAKGTRLLRSAPTKVRSCCEDG